MSTREILSKIKSGEICVEGGRLLSPKESKALSFKVSEGGILSVYGLSGRIPVTLHVRQWERLRAAIPVLTAVIEQNGSKSSTGKDGEHFVKAR